MEKVKNFLLGAIAGIFALIGIYLNGKSSGKAEQESETNEKILNDIAKVKNSTNSDNLKRVRSKYSKR